ncbi:MAG TPA: hypothetical protein PLH15_01900 [Spirochaetota bacterium]|nr:hypothetical protein [Spirochaetota bacterium]HQO23302.1 hypothetical protein [Spirochaetota bacterium]HQQ22577.1 hypothetical protein [Spirochaetota bacterium]
MNNFSSPSVAEQHILPHHTNFPFKKSVEKIIDEYGKKIKLMPISNSQVITVKGNTVKIEE